MYVNISKVDIARLIGWGLQRAAVRTVTRVLSAPLRAADRVLAELTSG